MSPAPPCYLPVLCHTTTYIYTCTRTGRPSWIPVPRMHLTPCDVTDFTVTADRHTLIPSTTHHTPHHTTHHTPHTGEDNLLLSYTQTQPPQQQIMFGYGGRGYPGGGGYGGAPRNPHFPGNTVTVMSFIMLILAILLLVAQIGLYYYCGWQAVCLVLPAFVACILFIITSIIGIAAGVERTNGLILTLLVMSFIVVIVTPINMGLWGLPQSEGGIPLDFYLVGDGTQPSDTLAAVYWGLLFIPILHWILFIVIIAICAFAICCPGYSFGGGVYGGRPAVYPPGYNPSAVYGRAPPPRPYCY